MAATFDCLETSETPAGVDVAVVEVVVVVEENGSDDGGEGAVTNDDDGNAGAKATETTGAGSSELEDSSVLASVLALYLTKTPAPGRQLVRSMTAAVADQVCLMLLTLSL
jgi:hypothetical protein